MKKLLLIPILLTVSQVLNIGLGFFLPGAMVVTDASMKEKINIQLPLLVLMDYRDNSFKRNLSTTAKRIVIKNKYTQHRIEDYSVLTKS